MQQKLEKIAKTIKDEANKMSDNELREFFLSHFKDDRIKSVKSINSEDIFHIINDTFVFQIRNNVKFCPIHEVPAKVLLNQTNIQKAVIINFLENDVIFKEVNK